MPTLAHNLALPSSYRTPGTSTVVRGPSGYVDLSRRLDSSLSRQQQNTTARRLQNTVNRPAPRPPSLYQPSNGANLVYQGGQSQGAFARPMPPNPITAAPSGLGGSPVSGPSVRGGIVSTAAKGVGAAGLAIGSTAIALAPVQSLLNDAGAGLGAGGLIRNAQKIAQLVQDARRKRQAFPSPPPLNSPASNDNFVPGKIAGQTYIVYVRRNSDGVRMNDGSPFSGVGPVNWSPTTIFGMSGNPVLNGIALSFSNVNYGALNYSYSAQGYSAEILLFPSQQPEPGPPDAPAVVQAATGVPASPEILPPLAPQSIPGLTPAAPSPVPAGDPVPSPLPETPDNQNRPGPIPAPLAAVGIGAAAATAIAQGTKITNAAGPASNATAPPSTTNPARTTNPALGGCGCNGAILSGQSQILGQQQQLNDKVDGVSAGLDAADLALLAAIKADTGKIRTGTGVDLFPADIPAHLNGKSGAVRNVTNLADQNLWMVEALDSVLGAYPNKTSIKAPDGSLSELVGDTMSDDLAEIKGMLMGLTIDSAEILHTATRGLIQAGSATQQAHLAQRYAKANAEFLGYDGAPEATKMPLSFTPGGNPFENLLSESQANIKGWKNTDNQDLKSILYELLQAASIIRARYWRKLDPKADFQAQMKANIQQQSSQVDAIGKNGSNDWNSYLERVEQGFSGETGDATPYGRDPSERPKIRDVGGDGNAP